MHVHQGGKNTANYEGLSDDEFEYVDDAGQDGVSEVEDHSDDETLSAAIRMEVSIVFEFAFAIIFFNRSILSSDFSQQEKMAKSDEKVLCTKAKKIRKSSYFSDEEELSD